MKNLKNIFRNSTWSKTILGKLHISRSTTSSTMIFLGCSWSHWIMSWMIITINKGRSNMLRSQECSNFNNKNKMDNAENKTSNNKMDNNSHNSKICSLQMDIILKHKNKLLQLILFKAIIHPKTRINEITMEKVITSISSMRVYLWIIS